MRTIADVLNSHPRNDVDAFWLVLAGFFLIALPADVADIWAIYAGYVIWAGYTFHRWYARLRSIEAWPPQAESTSEWPSR
jgi:hypothetical protein